MTLRDPRDLQGALCEVQVALRETIVTLNQVQLEQVIGVVDLMAAYGRFLDKEEQQEYQLKMNLMASQDMGLNTLFFKDTLAKVLRGVKVSQKLLLAEAVAEVLQGNSAEQYTWENVLAVSQ